MILRYILPLLAVIGIVFSIIFTFTYGQNASLPPNQLAEPPSIPYEKTLSGTGLIEANSRNIEIGSHLSGIISDMYVSEGQMVKAGMPLFKLDDGLALAELESRKKEVVAAQSRLATAQISVADEREALQRYEALSTTALSKNEVIRKRFSAQRAATSATTAKAELDNAKAALQAAKVMLDRLTVKAPTDGKILKVRVSVGEFIATGNTPQAPILMGNDTPLHLRVTIDENDVWRFTADAKATAALRSNKDIHVPLKFIRVEPYVQPKRNLSGAVGERVDTRVLEIIYEIEPNSHPLYIGQQMDVFIEEK